MKFILQGQLKFTPIADLNDPTELLPRVIPKRVRESARRISNLGYSKKDFLNLRRQTNLLRKFSPNAASRLDQLLVSKEKAAEFVRSQYRQGMFRELEQSAQEAATLFASGVGLLCLTRRNNSLPMWAHYAENASGLAVEFRNLREAFPGDDTGTLYEPRVVRYEIQNSGLTFDPTSHESLFFSKLPDWQYEQEVRVVLALTDCEVPPKDRPKLHLFSIAPKHVSRIILGWRMLPEEADAIRNLAKKHNPSVDVVSAKIQKGRVVIA